MYTFSAREWGRTIFLRVAPKLNKPLLIIVLNDCIIFSLCGYELVNSMLRRRISLSTIIGLKIPPIEGSNNANRNMKIVKLSLTIEVQWLCGLKNCIYFKKCETYFKTDFKPPNQVQFSCHPKCKLCDLWKMILWQIFAMAFKMDGGKNGNLTKVNHGAMEDINP